MAFVRWEMQGTEFANCSCQWGCPCQFNALPTHGYCRALTFVQIDRGHYGTIELDGLRWGILAAWPGAVHMGEGTFRVVVDERATLSQRAAIEAVAQGRDTEPGSLIWQVFSTTVTSLLPTVVAPIDLTIDVDARTASLRVPGIVHGGARPIANRKTGAPQQARVTLPHGFEFTEAEFASGDAQALGDIPLDFVDTHAHLAHIHWSTSGVVR